MSYSSKSHMRKFAKSNPHPAFPTQSNQQIQPPFANNTFVNPSSKTPKQSNKPPPFKGVKLTKDTAKNTTLNEEYKQSVSTISCLGKKGYTIPKSILTQEDLDFLKKDLFMRPIVAGGISYGAGPSDAVAFPVYRENQNKIYIPRFYGIQRYGLPHSCEINVGENIDVPFTKPLRDYQEKIIGIYMDYVSSSICVGAEYNGGGAILEVPCGRGKTIMALKIISLLKKKTLILVHKEFLMNQWIERMDDFLPTAKIGKIQGSVFDVENKDVVIGMIQTLYDKEYPADAFSSFGLTIIDEVHRIGSEQFSKTLLKTITPYMLGISATVDRKDGLTRVLNMFIGEKIYSEERENDDKVCVRAIEYVSNDTEFNEVECDFRGNPMYSTMISKLSNYVPRTEFIVRVIVDLLKEQPFSQIMILAHQRSILSYIYDVVNTKNIAEKSIGFYVGGMKEEALKETETKQIVLATYAMAAEALDIKTLSTLVMITPKTDIIQSVGRILRMKHKNPIVVDIVDKHTNFQKQWVQRKRFYKKCNYRIRMIDSTKYTGMELDWDNDRTWKWIFEPKNINNDSSGESDNGGDGGGNCGDYDEDDRKIISKKNMGCMISLECIEEDNTPSSHPFT